MNGAELVRRANAIRERAKLLESVKGSGFHDEDRNPARTDLYLAPQKNGLPRCSEHVVFFSDFAGEEVLFAGTDADRAGKALAEWERKARKLDPLSLTGTERKLLTRILPRLRAVLADDSVPVLCVRLDTWNDVLHALYAEGLGLSGAPLEE